MPDSLLPPEDGEEELDPTGDPVPADDSTDGEEVVYDDGASQETDENPFGFSLERETFHVSEKRRVRELRKEDQTAYLRALLRRQAVPLARKLAKTAIEHENSRLREKQELLSFVGRIMFGAAILLLLGAWSAGPSGVIGHPITLFLFGAGLLVGSIWVYARLLLNPVKPVNVETQVVTPTRAAKALRDFNLEDYLRGLDPEMFDPEVPETALQAERRIADLEDAAIKDAAQVICDHCLALLEARREAAYEKSLDRLAALPQGAPAGDSTSAVKEWLKVALLFVVVGGSIWLVYNWGGYIAALQETKRQAPSTVDQAAESFPGGSPQFSTVIPERRASRIGLPDAYGR